MRFGYRMAMLGLGIASFFSSCTRNYEGTSTQVPVAKYPCAGSDTVFESYVSEPHMLQFKDAVLMWREQSGVCRVGGKVVRYNVSPKFSEKPGELIDPNVTLTECDENGGNCLEITDETLLEKYINKLDSMLTGGNGE